MMKGPIAVDCGNCPNITYGCIGKCQRSDWPPKLPDATVKVPMPACKPLKPDGPGVEEQLKDALAKVDELRDVLGEHDLCTKLIGIWIGDKGRQIPWAAAIQIIATVTKMDPVEATRLLELE